MLELPTLAHGSPDTINGAAVLQFVVSGIAGDYIVGRRLSGVSTGASSGTISVRIAKPFLLRQSFYSGATRNGVTYTGATSSTRNASTGGTAISEKITPSYQAGDVIYAIGPVVGTAGVAGCVWVDLNVDGRAFAKVT